jgi:DNA-binding response OmpR family regulator
MISADATSLQIDRLRAAGANDYLTKPIDVRRLLAVIDATEPCSVPAILPPVTLEPPVVAG